MVQTVHSFYTIVYLMIKSNTVCKTVCPLSAYRSDKQTPTDYKTSGLMKEYGGLPCSGCCLLWVPLFSTVAGVVFKVRKTY